MKYTKYFIPLLALTLLFCGRPWGSTVTLMFTGDIIMHGPVKASAESRNEIRRNNISANNEGYNYLFERIKPLLSKGDIVCGNMEFPISAPYSGKPFIFNCRPEVIGAMLHSGFNLMTIANNHLLDQGCGGVINTIGYLNKYGMHFIGAGLSEEEARAGTVKEVRGWKIGLLGYTDLMNYPVPGDPEGYYINMFDEPGRVIEDIGRMNEKADFVVLVVHAGVEYALTPPDELRERMIKFAESGADLIIAHHPHIVQPFEKIITEEGRECYIFYSLGNFISNQSSTWATGRTDERLSTRDSAIVKFQKTKGGLFRAPGTTVGIIPVMTLNYTDSEGNSRIQTVEMREEIALLKKRKSRSKDHGESEKIKTRINEIKKRREAVRYSFFRYADRDDAVFIE